MDRTRRTPIVLVCSECKARNYKTTRKAGADQPTEVAPVELKKFCKHCQKHTMHKETK
ncbi:MAG: 50S ribosomal protein L33 [Polyangiaceae bacterium]|nr:50S ribosomal protein L33 [Polyangiaceae bacterium]